ncbi:MAG: hypothetical protein [Caudoviricetes sp.]|nr:MAG: hypothetical protein [Caudoviricetes sp.]
MNAHTPFDANQDWTNPYCQNSSNDPMVDALLGNAYHVVRTVYCNLGNLKLIYDFLNKYGMVLGVKSETELKAMPTSASYVRLYGFDNTNKRVVTDYLYVDGDRSGVIPDDQSATGSWILVATSNSDGGGDGDDGKASPPYIPYSYNNGSAIGGETTIPVPVGTVGVPMIVVEGYTNLVGYGFTYDAATLTVTLAQPLEPGDEVHLFLTGTPAVPDNPNVTDWVQINWLYNGGYAVGGEQVITIPYTFESVPAIYKNGERYYAGLSDKSYTVDAANQRILLTEPLDTNDRLIVTIGGESTTLIMSDRTIQEVARSANVKDSEVIISSNTTQYLNGIKVVYDLVAQKIYGLPSLPTNVYIGSVSNGQLTYNPGNITVNLLPIPGSAKEFEDKLASDAGASSIGADSGKTIQEELDTLEETSGILSNSVYKPIPVKYSPDYSQVMVASVNPQGLAQDDTYWYITEDTTSGGAYTCTLSRIDKVTNNKETFPGTFGTHGQGIGILPSGEVFIGGATNSFITVINFSAGTSSQVACTGFMKDFPFCYDSKTDLIYQLQDADGTSANITRIAVLSRTAGFISDNSIDRKLVKPGYPQGITTDGSFLYVTCGNSWAAASTGTWNDYWACFKVSLTGQVIERAMFRRTSMGVLTGGITVTSHEPQAVSWYKGKLSFLQYIGSSSATNAVIFTEDSDGSAIRAVPKNLWVDYYSLDELGINTSTLTSGSSLRTIVGALPDNASVTFSLSNEAAFLADTGIAFGVCKITRINANRAYAVAVESSSGLTATSNGNVSFVSIYDTIQSAPKMVRGSKPITLGYEGTTVATAPSTVTVSGMGSCNELVIHITHTAGTNPVTPYRFTKDEINYYVANSITLYLGDGTGFMSMQFTSTGISITGVTGSPIVRRVLLS